MIAAGRAPWAAGPAAGPAPAAGGPPAAVDVVVLGAGVAGLWIAAGLARAGASALVIGPDPGEGAGCGLALPGLDDHPGRLVDSLGDEEARALDAFAADGLRRLEGAGLLRPTGSARRATGPGEAEELARGAALLRAWGAPVEAVDGGLIDARGGQLDPAAALRALRARAEAAGARVIPGLRAARLGAGGRVVLNGGGEVRADVIVHAGDHGAGAVEPWLADKLWPVRLTHQRWAAAGPARPFSAGQSWVWAGPDGAGGLVGGGCRWACPHLEVGEVDPGQLRDDVVQKLNLVVPALVPGLAGAPVTHRWAEIATLTCDGLPLVGPLPGRPQELACLGLQGRPWSLGPAAAEAVLAGLLGDGGPRAPRSLLPGRFVGR